MAGLAIRAVGCLVFCCACQLTNAAYFNLTLEWGYRTPDCVERDPMVLINGQFPGPALRMKANEEVTIVVKNRLKGVATTMHWHGFDQVGTPWQDGAAGTSDCAIDPGEDRTYSFAAPPHPGTHYYHGHVGLAKESGAYGLLLVDPANCDVWSPSMAHDVEIPFLIADWYHGPALTLSTGLLVSPFRWVGDPQSILVNGQGHFNCSDNDVYSCQNEVCSAVAKTFATAFQRPYYLTANHHLQCRYEDCPGWYKVNFTAQKKHFFRICNAGTLSMLNVIIQNHTMTVVELDGEPVKPINVTSLDLHAGQRAGVIVVADQPPGLYWISIKVRGRPSVRHGAAVIRYTTATAPIGSVPPEKELIKLRALQPVWDDIAFTLHQQRNYEHPDAANAPNASEVAPADRISLLSTQEFYEDHHVSHIPPPATAGVNLIGQGLQRPEAHCDGTGGKILKWAVGRVTYHPTATPVLQSLYYHPPSEKLLDRAHGMIKLEKGKTYDIVLQNYPACNGVCETHPWHLHGHHFWVVGTWPGEFNGTLPAAGTGGKMYRRDTVMIIGEGEDHRPTTRRGCGFTVIRFVADNPGAWPLHCHAEWHQIMGMGATLYYPANTIPPPNKPEYHRICGDVTLAMAAQRVLQLGQPARKFSGDRWSWLTKENGQSLLIGIAALSFVMTAVLVKKRWDSKNRCRKTREGYKQSEAADFDSEGTNSSNERGEGAL